jgi:hypothetical protein
MRVYFHFDHNKEIEEQLTFEKGGTENLEKEGTEEGG